jgi:antitoxin (DNA-binding transcriptional repressor) of toxin-antitoxin stability system
MISAGIRELKAHLSRYLKQVASGQIVLVTDRGRVIAELRAPGGVSAVELRWQEMVASGTVLPAIDPLDRSWAHWPGLGLTAGTAQELIDLDRDE